MNSNPIYLVILHAVIILPYVWISEEFFGHEASSSEAGDVFLIVALAVGAVGGIMAGAIGALRYFRNRKSRKVHDADEQS